MMNINILQPDGNYIQYTVSLNLQLHRWFTVYKYLRVHLRVLGSSWDLNPSVTEGLKNCLNCNTVYSRVLYDSQKR